MVSEYTKMLDSISCPDCGGEVEIVHPPIIITKGDEIKEIFGTIKCKNCDGSFQFSHYFNCPDCGYYTQLPTNLCPACGSPLEPHFNFQGEANGEANICECEYAYCLIATKLLVFDKVCPLAGDKPIGYYTWM